MKKIHIFTGLALVAVAAITFSISVAFPSSASNPPLPAETEKDHYITFFQRSDEFKFSIKPFDNYLVYSFYQPSGRMESLGVMNLMEEKTLKSFMDIPEGTEGPPSINITFFQNPKNLDAKTWAVQHQYSIMNEKVLDIDDKKAFSFTSEGLYTNDIYIVSIGDYVAVLSGAYTSPEDQLRADFHRMVKTMDFEKL